MLSEQLLIPGQVAIRLVCSRVPQLKKKKYFVIDGLRLTFDLPTAPKSSCRACRAVCTKKSDLNASGQLETHFVDRTIGVKAPRVSRGVLLGTGWMLQVGVATAHVCQRRRTA